MRTKARSCLLSAYALSPLASAFPACTCLSSEDSSFMSGIAYPFEVLIALYYWMACVNKNSFVPFVPAVLTDPVAIQYLHVRKSPCCALFSDGLYALSGGDLVHTHVFCPSPTDIS